jgi:methionyl-tRNA synthetase
MAADLPLPKKVVAHGWLLYEENKMSKSRGNVVRPGPVVEVVGADALRYFLLREVTFGQDGSFSYDAVIQRYNADLANGLGNLASRTLTMIHQYRGGQVPKSDGLGEIAEAARATTENFLEAFDEFNFSRGLENAWAFLSVIDKFIVERAPWKLAKDPDPKAVALLDETLYTAAESLRIVCGWLYPVMPSATRLIWEQLGMREPIEALCVADLHWGKLPAGQTVGKVAPVFPRLELKPTIEKIQKLEEIERARHAVLLGKSPVPTGGPEAVPATSHIAIDDFAKVDLRVGLVLSAERVKGSDKLLHLKVDLAEAEPRSIVAGIAEAYAPEPLIGRKVVIVANLQPRKLRGLESNGMIVAASIEGGKPVLASFLEDVPVGARLK